MERKKFVQKEIISALTYKAFYDHMATIPTDFLQMPCYLQENKLYWLDIDWQNWHYSASIGAAVIRRWMPWLKELRF